MRKTVLILVLTSLAMLLASGPALAGHWKKLGTRQVSDRVDHDTIKVGAAEGRLTKLQLRSRRSSIRVRRVVVHFGNDTTQKFEKNFTISKGDESPVLDLDGGERVVRRVEFVYEESSIRRKKAQVVLWGRK